VQAVATGKARSPTVDSRVWWTGSDVVSANRRWVLIPRSAGWRSSSARYVGAVRLAWQSASSYVPNLLRITARLLLFEDIGECS